MKYSTEYRVTKTGLRVGFRSAEPDEAGIMIDYLKRVCGETPFLLSLPEEVNYTEEGERDFLESYEKSPDSLMLNAYVDGELAGNASFSPVSRVRRMRHRATMGIAIFKEYSGQGIGYEMISILIEEAKNCGYEILELDVYAKNTGARRLYEKVGFRECGAWKNAVKQPDGEYDDLILMQREL